MATPSITIDFEGRQIDARSGDTIASALLRAGVTTFSRGPKYHRPRGPFCLAGSCGQCHMRVDDNPNIPTCLTPATSGQKIERQNVLGSGDVDLLRAVDFLYPEGLDHHHLMTRFRLLNSAARAVARRLSGIGELPSKPAKPPELLVRRDETVVVGAGPAGLAAADAIVKAGKTVFVIEGREVVGGWARNGFSRDSSATPESLVALELSVLKHCELALRTHVLGVYSDGLSHWLLASDGACLWQVGLKRLIVATGGIERPALFESNDLPGVFAGRALARLAAESGLVAGKRIVIVALDHDAETVAASLKSNGAEIVATLESPPVSAIGRSQVTGVRVRDESGKLRTIRCDTVAVVGPRSPAYELAAEAGVEAELRGADGFVVPVDGSGRTSLDWLFAAGTAAGMGSDSIASGTRAGVAACR